MELNHDEQSLVEEYRKLNPETVKIKIKWVKPPLKIIILSLSILVSGLLISTISRIPKAPEHIHDWSYYFVEVFDEPNYPLSISINPQGSERIISYKRKCNDCKIEQSKREHIGTVSNNTVLTDEDRTRIVSSFVNFN